MLYIVLYFVFFFYVNQNPKQNKNYNKSEIIETHLMKFNKIHTFPRTHTYECILKIEIQLEFMVSYVGKYYDIDEENAKGLFL